MIPEGPSLEGSDWTPSLALFGSQVEMTCEAVVAGETVRVRQAVCEEVYQDPAARQVIEAAIRQALMMAILEKCTPKISVRR